MESIVLNIYLQVQLKIDYLRAGWFCHLDLQSDYLGEKKWFGCKKASHREAFLLFGDPRCRGVELFEGGFCFFGKVYGCSETKK